MQTDHLTKKLQFAPDLADDYTEQVLNIAENFIYANAKNPSQYNLLKTAFKGLTYQVYNWFPQNEKNNSGCIPFIHLPIFIYAGICGRIDEKALQLSAATSLLFLGIDIFDDVADGDTPDHWGNYGRGERNLIGATLLSSLPQLLVGELQAPSSTILQMQQTLADGLLTMSAGQQADIGSGNNNSIKMKNVLDSVSSKSGAELKLFARMAALLANADETQIKAYEQLANAIGIAGQLNSDCYDLFQDPECRDLVHGTRTLPVVLYLNSLQVPDKDEFILLLDEAKKNDYARQAVKEKIKQSGAFAACAIVIENYCQEARKALTNAAPDFLVKNKLETMIADNSFQ